MLSCGTDARQNHENANGPCIHCAVRTVINHPYVSSTVLDPGLIETEIPSPCAVQSLEEEKVRKRK